MKRSAYLLGCAGIQSMYGATKTEPPDATDAGQQPSARRFHPYKAEFDTALTRLLPEVADAALTRVSTWPDS
jgi:hypothetical protein